jgi:stearoyl-CoA desaturase (delta-9 desaturase)
MRIDFLEEDALNLYSHRRLNWSIITVLVVLHASAIAALFMFSWKALLVSVFLYWIGNGLGVSMGYHRLHTHRSYKVPRWLDYFLAICATFSLEGGPIFWVATHRVHHQFSDKPGDPHSPRDGVWWSHIGWMLVGESGHSNTKLLAKYAPDLAKDPFYVWLNKYHWTFTVALVPVLFLIGGPSMMFWGVGARIVFGLHATWAVNSVTHLWGSRRFETRDDSTNNWLVALLTFGEGWHNNHHAHPASARHGLAWYELDISWLHISVLKWLGMARAVRVAKIEKPGLERRAA